MAGAVAPARQGRKFRSVLHEDESLNRTPVLETMVHRPAHWQGNEKRTPPMTAIEIQLPALLAREAARAGLLAPDRIESMLRRQLHIEELQAFLREEEALEELVMQEIQVEVDAVRADRRAAKRSAARA